MHKKMSSRRSWLAVDHGTDLCPAYIRGILSDGTALLDDDKPGRPDGSPSCRHQRTLRRVFPPSHHLRLNSSRVIDRFCTPSGSLRTPRARNRMVVLRPAPCIRSVCNTVAGCCSTSELMAARERPGWPRRSSAVMGLTGLVIISIHYTLNH
jgi:hypothetical protein